jgi:hypothetical protein
MSATRPVGRVAILSATIVILMTMTACVTAHSSSAPAEPPSVGPSRAEVPTDSAGNYMKSPDLAHTPVPPGPLPSCIDLPSPQATGARVTVSALASDAAVIVVGEFEGYGAARWDNPERSRPIGWYVDALIVRPTTIRIERLIRGDAAAVAHEVSWGGQIGCDRIAYSELSAGSRYVFFLSKVLDSDGQWRGDFLIWSAWPVDAEDIVTTEAEGRVPLSKIFQVVAEVTLAPPFR